MKSRKIVSFCMTAFAVLFSLVATSALGLENNGGYVISEVSVRQRWPWDRKVDIDFHLAKPAGASSDQAVVIGVAITNGTEGIEISEDERQIICWDCKQHLSHDLFDTACTHAPTADQLSNS